MIDFLIIAPSAEVMAWGSETVGRFGDLLEEHPGPQPCFVLMYTMTDRGDVDKEQLIRLEGWDVSPTPELDVAVAAFFDRARLGGVA